MNWSAYIGPSWGKSDGVLDWCQVLRKTSSDSLGFRTIGAKLFRAVD